ncbi:hypothetical protein [Proteiniclasticum sediminis]|uniref:hypothetical protein n=1 Tax=Proteiniclasticum sediminis TaxID=2804028 RepID=UPI001BA474DA|nr:hypothetical protein [Proteiniclasticum sediminis]
MSKSGAATFAKVSRRRKINDMQKSGTALTSVLLGSIGKGEGVGLEIANPSALR